MPKRLLLPFLPGGLMLVAGVAGTIAGPAARTQSYFAFQREWLAHWPLEHGQFLPRAVEPALYPLAPVWVQVEPHVRMWLDPADYVSHQILETGSCEPTSWAALQQHLAAGDTFIDVGAHIGYYSLRAAPVVGPSGHVIAIEPNPDTLPKLHGNIQASGATTINVQPFACAEVDATLDLFAASRTNTGETSLSQSNASQDGPPAATYRVRARPLDDIVRDAGVSRVDAVKIDVEGAEMMVLKGAHETLDRYHPALLVELVDRQLQAMGSSANEVVQFLHAHGYTARRAFGANFEFVADTAKNSN